MNYIFVHLLDNKVFDSLVHVLILPSHPYQVLGLPKGSLLRSLRPKFCIYTYKLLARRGRGAISLLHQTSVRALYRVPTYNHRITMTRLSGQLEYAGR